MADEVQDSRQREISVDVYGYLSCSSAQQGCLRGFVRVHLYGRRKWQLWEVLLDFDVDAGWRKQGAVVLESGAGAYLDEGSNACFELLYFPDRKQHYWISRESKYYCDAPHSAERLCVPCDKLRGGPYLTKVLEERSGPRNSPRTIIALLVEDHPEEAWRLKKIGRVMDYLLQHGPKPRGKRPLTMADVKKWARARFLSEMKKLVARSRKPGFFM